MKIIVGTILGLALAGSPLFAGQEPDDKDKPKQEEPKKEQPKPKPKQEPKPDDREKPKPEPKQQPAPAPRPEDRQKQDDERRQQDEKQRREQPQTRNDRTPARSSRRNAATVAGSAFPRSDFVPASAANTTSAWRAMKTGASSTVATILNWWRRGQRTGFLTTTALSNRTATTTTW